MKNFTVIIALMLLAATASAQGKVREMANETYVNRAKTSGAVKKDGVLVGDRKGGGKATAKDGVLVGDRSENNAEGETSHGNKDGETSSGNRDGVLVGDRKGGGKATAKDGVLVGDKTAPVKLNIYPNPTNGLATLQAPAGTNIAYVQVFNTQGRQQMTVNGTKNQNLSVNMGALNPGTYIFRILLSNGASQSVSIIRK